MDSTEIVVLNEHEHEIRTQPKVPAICQFINIFKNVLKFSP